MNLEISTIVYCAKDYNPKKLIATQEWVAIKEKNYLVKNIPSEYNNLEKLSLDIIFKYGEQELKYFESVKHFQLSNKQKHEGIEIEFND